LLQIIVNNLNCHEQRSKIEDYLEEDAGKQQNPSESSASLGEVSSK
jgi:hypothetical protein